MPCWLPSCLPLARCLPSVLLAAHASVLMIYLADHVLACCTCWHAYAWPWLTIRLPAAHALCLHACLHLLLLLLRDCSWLLACSLLPQCACVRCGSCAAGDPSEGRNMKPAKQTPLYVRLRLQMRWPAPPVRAACRPRPPGLAMAGMRKQHAPRGTLDGPNWTVQAGHAHSALTQASASAAATRASSPCLSNSNVGASSELRGTRCLRIRVNCKACPAWGCRPPLQTRCAHTAAFAFAGVALRLSGLATARVCKQRASRSTLGARHRTWARRVERHWLRPRTRWLHGGIARMPGTRHQAQRGCACAEHEPGATAGCKTASIAAAACRAWPPSRRRGPLLTRGVCRRAECAAADTRRQPVGRCPLRAQGWTFPQQARARLWLSHLACRRTRWRRAGAKV